MRRGSTRKERIQAEWAPFYLSRLASVLPRRLASCTATLPEYGAAHCPDESDPRAMARHRMKALYAARDEVPLYLRHALGWWMDTHVPVIMSDERTVSGMYRRRLAPEQNHCFPPCAITPVVAYLWLPSTVGKLAASETAAVKLLRKGSVMPPSIRYIGTQLARCASIEGESERIARAVVLMHALGMYPGRKNILPPDKRLDLYAMSTAELVTVLASRGSRELYCIVATYLVWATRAEIPLWRLCLRLHSHYIKTIMGLNLEFNTAVHLDMSRHYVSWRQQSSYDLVAAALEVKKKMPVWVQTALAGLDVETVCRAGAVTGRVSTALLEAAGITAAGAGSLVQSFATKVATTAVLDALSVEDRARLYVFMLSRASRRAVRITLLSASTAAKQREVCLREHGMPQLYACVCIACGTWRPKSRSISGLSKATGGVVVNYAEQTVICCACTAGWSVCAVPLVGRLVWAKLRLTAESTTIAICCECGIVAHPIHSSGLHLYCATCLAAMREKRAQPTVCAVCEGEVRAGTGAVVDAFDDVAQKRVEVSLCRWHHRVARDLGPARTVAGISALLADHPRVPTRVKGHVRTAMPRGRRR